MNILAIETSCDETAAAVVQDGKIILSNVVASQADEHAKFGGVVPEIASRRHSENILWVVENALNEADCSIDDVSGKGKIDAIAVTYAPGLIGALLVGVSFAKGLALAKNLPLISVHHIAGHIAANYLSQNTSKSFLKPPFLSLVSSGGHTHIIEVSEYTKFKVLARTRDDAAGESFDKIARVLGLPYPGGVQIDKLAQNGDKTAFKLPFPKVPFTTEIEKYDFSFSGLKTAVINIVHNAEQKGETINKADVAASFQRTVAEMIVTRLMTIAKDTSHNIIVAAGGVIANSSVRELLKTECERNNFELYIPPISLCGDNAAMVGAQGYFDYLAGKKADETLNAVAYLDIGEI